MTQNVEKSNMGKEAGMERKEKADRLKDLREFGGAIWFLLKWFMISVGVGLIVGSISSLFGHTLIFANNLNKPGYEFFPVAPGRSSALLMP